MFAKSKNTEYLSNKGQTLTTFISHLLKDSLVLWLGQGKAHEISGRSHSIAKSPEFSLEISRFVVKQHLWYPLLQYKPEKKHTTKSPRFWPKGKEPRKAWEIFVDQWEVENFHHLLQPKVVFKHPIKNIGFNMVQPEALWHGNGMAENRCCFPNTSPASICSACEPSFTSSEGSNCVPCDWAAATNSRLWHWILVGVLTIAYCNPHILRLYFIPFIKQPTRVLDTPQVCSGSII